MTQATLRLGGRGRLVAGLLLAGGLFFGLGTAAPAQSAKTDPKNSGSQFTPVPTTEDAVKIINEMISAKWKDDKGAELYKPAERCSDYEFIRRVSLDIVGRIASVDEIDKFMKDPASQRRHILVDRLLASQEYTENWSTIWTYWLMTRTGERLYKDQIHLWLEEEVFAQKGEDGKPHESSVKDLASRLVTAKGKTNDNGAVNYILAHLGGSTAGTARNARPTKELMEKEGQFDMVPVTARTVRLFLGYQIQCTQCHDHPFNADWKQKNFWGVNAFFRQVQRVGEPPNMKKKGMPTAIMTLADNEEYNRKGVVYYEKRNGVFLPSEAVFLDGSKLGKEASQGQTRREELAKFLTGHKNFSKAYVNRMWSHFFSRGMNEKPVADDFGEHNPLIHDELLDKLGELFGAANYNPKAMIRWMALSDAYQLKATANKTNEKPDDEVYFSRQMLKAMSPEQLYDSLTVATMPNTKRGDDEQKVRRGDWLRRLTTNFGDDEGNETTFNGTVVQALLMMNGRDLNGALAAAGGTLDKAKGKQGKAAVDHLFLAALNRPATQKEYTQLMAAATLKGVKETDANAALNDIFWALLNCNEFILNH
jgi:hypothetical protein